MTFADWSLFLLLFICGSMGLTAMFRPTQSRWFWYNAAVCTGCLAFVLVMFAIRPSL